MFAVQAVPVIWPGRMIHGSAVCRFGTGSVVAVP
jgi:hypothetical protein